MGYFTKVDGDFYWMYIKQLFVLTGIIFFFANLTWATQSTSFNHPPKKENKAEGVPYPLIGLGYKDGFTPVILVVKSTQKLYLLSFANNKYELLLKFNCSTGKKDGDKEKPGDLKTPEGVYFITKVIDGRKLPPKYGVRAFVLNYPSWLDKNTGREGNGIWLHGTNKKLVPNDTNGCVVLNNQDLLHLSGYTELHITPIIIVYKLNSSSWDSFSQESKKIQDFIFKWKGYWEKKDINQYMSCYSKSFKSENLDWQSFKSKKMDLNKRYQNINVILEDLRVFKFKDVILVSFLQDYYSNKYNCFGLKRLYLKNEGGDWKIIIEQWIPLTPALKKYKTRLAGNVFSPGKSASDKSSLGSQEQSVHFFIFKWKGYWEEKDINQYMSCYSKSFKSENLDWQSWKEHKSGLNEKNNSINVKIHNIKLIKEKNRVVVTFRQDYTSSTYSDLGVKKLCLKKRESDWEIVSEHWKSF